MGPLSCLSVDRQRVLPGLLLWPGASQPHEPIHPPRVVGRLVVGNQVPSPKPPLEPDSLHVFLLTHQPGSTRVRPSRNPARLAPPCPHLSLRATAPTSRQFRQILASSVDLPVPRTVLTTGSPREYHAAHSLRFALDEVPPACLGSVPQGVAAHHIAHWSSRLQSHMQCPYQPDLVRVARR